MKKIGLLTFHNTINYGAVLQGFALEMKMRELGADCEIINYHCENVERREYCLFPKYKNGCINYLRDIKTYFTSIKKRLRIKKFVKDNMYISNLEYNRKNIINANLVYDKFVVGSDMVFNLNITNGDLTYYLDFADKGKRNSYAASFGEERFDDNYLHECVSNLNEFDYLSVREMQTRDYFDSVLHNNVHVDCDPTLLYDGTFWKKYENIPHYIPKKKYILIYFDDKDGLLIRTAQKIASDNNYEIIILKNSKEKYDNCKNIRRASIGEFLYYIHNAELVITGSYHGLIFSINYNTNFMYFNRANSNRMESIAQLTNSTDRRITHDYIPNITCDFKLINKAVDKARNNSIKNLKKIIIGENDEK